ncbi:MAG: VanZ family protein [Crocinitomicaceae bacterium]
MILRFSLIIVLVGITYLSLTSLEKFIVGNDKISHFIAYSILMFNAGLVFFKPKKTFLIAILLCLTYGGLIEVAQHFVPGRSMSRYDMVANALGIGIGVVLTYLLYRPVIRILQSRRII